MHIGLFGLSGSGKSFLIREFVKKHPDYLGLSASDLIKQAGQDTNYETINKSKVEKNQSYLIYKYELIRKQTENTIIELHNVVETTEGASWIKEDVLLSLKLEQVAFLNTPPQLILENRKIDKSKKRPESNLIKTKDLQRLSIENLKNIYSTFDIYLLSKETGITQLEELIYSGTPTKSH